MGGTPRGTVEWLNEWCYIQLAYPKVTKQSLLVKLFLPKVVGKGVKIDQNTLLI